MPNKDGTLALYTVSTYSFEAHKKISQIKVLHLSSGQSNLITEEEKTSEPHWLGDGNQLIWLKEGDKAVTHIVHGDVDRLGKTYVLGTVSAPISDVRLKVLDATRIAIAFAAQAKPDGSLFNAETQPKKYSTGRVYSSLMVRHWDKYITPNKKTIWYGLLVKSKPDATDSYRLSNITNALSNTRLESPIPPFGGAGDFDLGADGIGFVAKDPSLDPAANTRSDFYYLDIPDFLGPSSKAPRKFGVHGLEGASSSPRISPDGTAVVFLQMKENGYESDKNRIVYISSLTESTNATEFLSTSDGKGSWDRSPWAVSWSLDGKSLYLEAEEHGRGLLYQATIAEPNQLPKPLTDSGYISSVKPLASDSPLLFLSSTSLIDNSIYTILDPSNPSQAKQISSNSANGTSFALSPHQISDIWFPGAGDYQVHAWVVKPSNFSSHERYPLAYLIHGGPQASWADRWSTRWNPAVFAEQGYVVVLPNPTGSTGYGQAFCDAIRGSWGGRPYEDLVRGFEHIQHSLPYIDTSRAVALGASYGGYMINWLQGQPLGRAFRALVCHDGVFSLPNQLASDEQYFPNHDLGGPLWTHPAGWERWNPARFTAAWATPELVIHNELDYRLLIAEGLAAFNVLQERRVESRFLTFPDENHWVLKEENSLHWHTVVLNWINRFVGLPAYRDEGEGEGPAG